MSATKEEYLAYREKAKEMIRMMDSSLRVTEHANVQPAEDGAFVECVIWIPKELISERR